MVTMNKHEFYNVGTGGLELSELTAHKGWIGERERERESWLGGWCHDVTLIHSTCSHNITPLLLLSGPDPGTRSRSTIVIRLILWLSGSIRYIWVCVLRDIQDAPSSSNSLCIITRVSQVCKRLTLPRMSPVTVWVWTRCAVGVSELVWKHVPDRGSGEWLQTVTTNRWLRGWQTRAV